MIQQTLYYNAPSASAVLTDNPPYQGAFIPAQNNQSLKPPPFLLYDDISSLIVSSSGFIVGKSGSVDIFALPIATTNLIYGEYPLAKPLQSYTEIPGLGTSILTQSIDVITSSFQLNILYKNPTYNYLTSSYFQITSSNTDPSYSLVNYSASGEEVSTTILASADQYYTIYLSSDPASRYDTTLTVFDKNSNTFLAAKTESNATLSASFFIANDVDKPILGAVNINAYLTVVPNITMTWLSLVSSSVIPADDLNGWNSYLGVTASLVITSSNSVALYGQNLSTAVSLSLDGEQLTTASFLGLSSIEFLDWQLNNLSNTQDLSQYKGLKYVNIANNNLSGSLQSLNTLSNLRFFNCRENSVSGTIPNLSSNRQLEYFECSFNNLTGTIPNLDNNTALETFYIRNNNLISYLPSFENNRRIKAFDCSFNSLSGSIPSQYAYLPQITTIILSNNHFTGSLPPIGASTTLLDFFATNNELTGNIPGLNPSLVSFDISFNSCSGDIPNLSNNTQLTYIDLYKNQLSGSIPDLSNLSLLEFFDCGYNFLTGSIPNLDNNTLLLQFSCQSQSLSGNLPTLSNNAALIAFDASNNLLTGNIPYLGNTNLLAFSVADNQLSGYDGGGIPASLLLFLAQNNQLTQPAVDSILGDLDAAGAVSGSLALFGGTNSAPSLTGLTYKANLIAKSWTVLTN